MQKKNRKKNFSLQKFIIMFFFVLIGLFCGVLIARYSENAAEISGSSVFYEPVTFILLFAGLYVAMFLQIILHEAGHLIGGFLSGYTFTSFRIGSFILLRENGKIQFRRISITGTGGQCLMEPPENNTDDREIPVILYNMGGSLMNLLTGFLAFAGYIFLGQTSLTAAFLLMTAIVGFFFALINGLPLATDLINNDGRNTVVLAKSPESRRALAVQLRINVLLSKGDRTRDMPQKYFRIPSDEEMKDSMLASLGVLSCSRRLDEHRFEETRQLIEHFLEIESQIVGLNRNMMVCDLIYCLFICEEPLEKTECLLTKQQRKFMKAMKKFPSVIRTEYVYTLLGKHDMKAAERIKQQFEKIAKTYPYPGDIKSEKELMEIALEKYCSLYN